MKGREEEEEEEELALGLMNDIKVPGATLSGTAPTALTVTRSRASGYVSNTDVAFDLLKRHSGISNIWTRGGSRVCSAGGT